MSNIASVLLYLSTYLVSALLLQLAAKASRKWVKIFLFLLSILPPCLLASLRYQVGTDYMSYYRMFTRNAKLPFTTFLQSDSTLEPGVYFISRIAGVFDSSELYFFLFAAVIYAPVAWRILEKKDEAPVALLAFLFLMGSFTGGLNIMRQAAAASICLYALQYIYEGKFVKYVIAVTLAATFHITAIICFPIYYIWHKRQELSNFHIRAWLIIIAYGIVVLNFSSIVSLLGEKYSSYGEQNVQGGNLSLLLDLTWLIIFLLFNRAIVKKDPKSGLLIVMVLIGNILGLTGLRNTYAKRIGMYFTYPNFLLMPQLRYGFTKRSGPVMLGLVLIYGIVMFILTYGILGQADIIPYQSVFQFQ